MGNFLQTSDVSKYASNGILLPLDEYINETDTPNIYKFFEDYPKSKAANYLPDGHMYSLPQFVEYEPQYLENTIFINKTWLDKLNLDVPKTMDDLLEVLRAFKTGDPNGNGQADEIGMSFLEKSGYQYPEALLSCWGVAAKSGAFDRLMIAGERLIAVIKKCQGMANKDLGKFADQINSLCDKWDR